MGAKLGLELGWFDGSCVGGNLGFGVGLSVVGVNEGLSLGFLDVLVTGKATLVYFVSITSKAIFWSKHSSNGEIVPTFSFLVQGFHKIKCPFFKGHGTGLLVCILVPFSGVGPFGVPSNLDLIDRIRVIAEVQLSFVVACNIEGIVASHRRREVCLHSSAKVISTIGW